MQTTEEKKTHYLYPAALFASPKPHIISTVLGSCIAVCLWDQNNKVGGMNHFMLPLWNGVGLSSPKFGNIAIVKLIEKVKAMGGNKHHLIAKVFGGSTRLETSQNHFQIGKRNFLVAEELLKAHNIPMLSYSVGGNRGRKIFFHTDTGEVFMKILPDIINPVKGLKK